MKSHLDLGIKLKSASEVEDPTKSLVKYQWLMIRRQIPLM